MTIPEFEVVGSYARKRSGLETMNFAPFVPADLKQQWEKYSVENLNRWLDPSKVGHKKHEIHATMLLTFGIMKTFRLGESTTLTDADFHNDTISPVIVPLGPPDPNTTLYIPWWTSSPPPFSPEFTNSDLYPLQAVRDRLQAMEALSSKCK